MLNISTLHVSFAARMVYLNHVIFMGLFFAQSLGFFASKDTNIFSVAVLPVAHQVSCTAPVQITGYTSLNYLP